MEPWEQHHAVINMPRFAYKPASVLQHSTGFLVTCPFRREKSATREAIALLEEYVKFAESCKEDVSSIEADRIDKHYSEGETCSVFSSIPSSEQSSGIPSNNGELFIFPEYSKIETKYGEIFDDGGESGNRKILNGTKEAIPECEKEDENGEIFGDSSETRSRKIPNVAKEAIQVFEKEGKAAKEPKEYEMGKDCKVEAGMELLCRPTLGHPFHSNSDSENHTFSLVKLSTMGVIYICNSSMSCRGAVRIAARIMKDIQTGTRAPPRWCLRMLPVQATCSIKKEDLQAVVSHLVKDYLRDHVVCSELPINYAVAFNRRGPGIPTKNTVFTRNDCIKIVTSAVEQASSSVKVNLTSPQMVVLVEMIPVAGIQDSLTFVVSVLPGELMVSKPKLNVRPLTLQFPIVKKRKELS